MSEQMICVQPRVSTAVRRLTTAFFFAIFVMPIESTMVTTVARPSGIAATASEIAMIKLSAKLQGKSKLEVSACFFYEADLQGHYFPIYFIVAADGKQFYPQARVRRNSDPRGQWFKAGATLDLTPYTNIRHVEIYSLGWKYGSKYFSGTVYIDNFEAFAE